FKVVQLARRGLGQLFFHVTIIAHLTSYETWTRLVTAKAHFAGKQRGDTPWPPTIWTPTTISPSGGCYSAAPGSRRNSGAKWTRRPPRQRRAIPPPRAVAPKPAAHKEAAMHHSRISTLM